MKSFLVTGRTGVGKSSFINMALKEFKAETNCYVSETHEVNRYEISTKYGDLVFYDTPGLAEGDDEKLDYDYLTLIKQNVDLSAIDTFLYVTKLNETRFRSDEMQAIDSINAVLGKGFWDKAELVLTFASKVPEEIRKKVVADRISDIENYINREVYGRLYNNYRFNNWWILDSINKGWCSNGTPLAQAFSRKIVKF